ncbi:hypothetical protein IW261DRAFT_1611540, partial [Armillaria novae-zelandiae]
MARDRQILRSLLLLQIGLHPLDLSVCAFLSFPLRDGLLSTTFDCLSFTLPSFLHSIIHLSSVYTRCITRNMRTSKEIR